MLDVLYWFSIARSESTLAFRGDSEAELQRSNFGSGGFGGKNSGHKLQSMYAMDGSKEGGFKEGGGAVGNFPNRFFFTTRTKPKG